MKTGAYFDPICPNQGLDVFVGRNGRTLGFWYTYQDSLPRWYIVRNGKVITTVGGTWDDPTTYSEKAIGAGEFVDGWFKYSTTEHGRGAIPLTLIAAGEGGAYHDPAKVGSGLSIIRFPDLRLVADWFTYDHSGHQRWFSCIGRPESLRIREGLGCKFRYPGGEMVEVGKATFVADTATFTYDLDARALRASGELELVRDF